MSDHQFLKVSDGNGDAALVHVSDNRLAGAATIDVDTVANVPAKFIGTWGTVGANGLITPATKRDFMGHVDGADLVIDAMAPGNTDDGNTAGQVIIIKPNTHWSNLVASFVMNAKGYGTPEDVQFRDVTGRNGVFDTITVSGAPTTQGWTTVGQLPNTITPHASVPNVYTLTFNGVDVRPTIAPRMFLQGARSVAAPDKSTLLNGTNQYWNRTASINGITFTDDFAVSAWIKLNSYNISGDSVIASRYNSTSGWKFVINSNGQLKLSGFNGGSGNESTVISSNSVPIGRWVHVAAQLDMSSFTATTTTSYIMIDGVDTSAAVSRSGTNPTSLVQAGNLEIGTMNSGTFPLNGQITQVALYNAKVSQATILASKDRGLTGSETNLISAWAFNGSGADLNTTNNNTLTGQNSVVATNADSPFGNNGASTTLEYMEILDTAFSTNSTVVVRVPPGCQLPSTGGLSALNYSTQPRAYGLPVFSNTLSMAESRVAYQATATIPSYAQVTGMTCPVYLPANTKYKVRFWARSVTNNTAAQFTQLSVWEGTVTGVPTALMRQEAVFQANTGGGQEMGGATIEVELYNSTAGFKTLNIGAAKTAGSGTVGANPTGSMYAVVELC